MFGQFMSNLMNYTFLQNALITSIIVGVTCGILGSFITLKGMSLIGDAISHAVLPGVAISYMIGINFFYGAVVAGLLTALGINYVDQKSRVKADSAIGILFSAFFAAGVILIQKAQSAIDLTSILFGNILTVSNTDRYITLVVGVIVILIVFLFYKELLITTFDPTMARAYGLPVDFINYGIMILLTLVSVASLQTVGVILVVALLITPASTAYMLTNDLSKMTLLSAMIGAIAAVAGLYFSFAYNLPSGAVIVLAAATMFVLAFLFAPEQGLVWRKVKKAV
ncbi:metal ABC transporter permease [Aerococcus sp. HMSC10H05]|uniref:metal ABC transporter permease n=1 Tax=Aerococcus sp. HMSC10H05 TaxID=1581084 RepID=UPI0009F5CA65|nr:metal ABC transporter permease [Aerococcus sp. HMSC10H05]